jgi:transcriptional regulator with XRE-family HTH domain
LTVVSSKQILFAAAGIATFPLGDAVSRIHETMARNTRTRGPQPIDVQIGARIRLRRKMMGMTQSEMADRIGVTFQQLQKYERGANRIGASRLVRICQVLEVPPASLFDSCGDSDRLAGGREMDSLVAAFHADATAPQLISVWPRLSPVVKRSMIKVMTIIVHQADGPASPPG